MAAMEGQKERLKTFIAFLGIPTYKFEQNCDLARGYVSAMRKGIGENALGKISEHYSELNPVWLLTGAGEMLKARNIQTITGDGNHHNSNGCDDRHIAHLEEEVAALRKELSEMREERRTLLSIIENLSKQRKDERK